MFRFRYTNFIIKNYNNRKIKGEQVLKNVNVIFQTWVKCYIKLFRNKYNVMYQIYKIDIFSFFSSFGVFKINLLTNKLNFEIKKS